MDFIHSIILGLVQGLTEFIPVSSSAHLVIVRQLLGENIEIGLAFDAVLQLATIFAVLVYFRKDLWRLCGSFVKIVFKKEVNPADKTMIGAIVIGTIPAVLAGLFLEKYMETVFRGLPIIAVTLIVGSLIFFAAEKYAKNTAVLSWKKGLCIGLFQCLALVPGMSRSGMTISGGLFMGLSRETAARFSFLLSFPIILGSGLKKLLDMYQAGLMSTVGFDLLLASSVAFVVGLASIHFLITFLKNHSLRGFAWYRIVVAIAILVFTLL
jgi:undecaprenyl-diphosphatase